MSEILLLRPSRWLCKNFSHLLLTASSSSDVFLVDRFGFAVEMWHEEWYRIAKIDQVLPAKIQVNPCRSTNAISMIIHIAFEPWTAV